MPDGDVAAESGDELGQDDWTWETAMPYVWIVVPTDFNPQRVMAYGDAADSEGWQSEGEAIADLWDTEAPEAEPPPPKSRR